jgi:hypothetical protein
MVEVWAMKVTSNKLVANKTIYALFDLNYSLIQ